jgi:uncharacterized protein (TIGR02186 family)
MTRAGFIRVVVVAALASGMTLPLFCEPAALAQTLPKAKRSKPTVGTGQPPVAAVAAERIEADVSTRTIAVSSGYSGAEILVFGTIENSRQPSAESGFYDVAVVVEGSPEPLMVRKKGRVAGLWVNTKTFDFNAVPSYYAVASTRPLEEFADVAVLEENGIGLDAVRMAASAGSAVRVSSEDLIAFKDAVSRLKLAARLFQRDDYGVIFTGRSLFRATIALPATVPVGPLTARVYLFNDGKLLSRFQSRVVLEREGMERWIYAFALERPFLYGIVAVMLALATGVVASAVFRRRGT